ncbi:LOW QUALITY PROTEIN: TetR family transcriptional regulator, partial [Streptomyces himastatinicus ATCC 53653]
MRQEFDVAARVRQVIDEAGCTQREFARRVVMDPSKLSRSLGGTRRFTVAELARIADAGRVDAGWLLGTTGPGEPAADTPEPAARTSPPEGGRPLQIVRETVRLIAEHGFHSVRVADIAAACDTSTAAIHYHFPGPRRITGSRRALVHGRGHHAPRRPPRRGRRRPRGAAPAHRPPGPGQHPAASPVAGVDGPVVRGRALDRHRTAARRVLPGVAADDRRGDPARHRPGRLPRRRPRVQRAAPHRADRRVRHPGGGHRARRGRHERGGHAHRLPRLPRHGTVRTASSPSRRNPFIPVPV